MSALRWVGFGLGLVVIAGISLSMVRTVIVPGGHVSPWSRVVTAVVRAALMVVVDRLRTYERKDTVLAVHGPLALLALLLSWLLVYLLGYALVVWPFIGGSFGNAVRSSGSSMLTLGFVAATGAAPTLISFAAAVTGLVVIALEIAFLPAIYSSFNRRETLVTMLESRAGAPAWGPELLARHQLVDIVDNLPDFYAEWERWAADVAESHTNYPVLIEFRSPDPLRSWIVGLIAVLDSAALYHSLSPGRAPSEARLCLRMGFTSLREICRAAGLPYDPDPYPDAPIALTYEDFLAGVQRLEAVGFPMERPPEEAWPHFRGWRVNYEATAYALADRVAAPPGPWSGPRRRIQGDVIPPRRPVDRRPGEPKGRTSRYPRS